MANFPQVEYVVQSKITAGSSKKENKQPKTTYAKNMGEQYKNNSQISQDFDLKVAAV